MTCMLSAQSSIDRMTTTRPRPHNTSCLRIQYIDHGLATRDRNSASYSSTSTWCKTLPVGNFGICVQTFAIDDRVLSQSAR